MLIDLIITNRTDLVTNCLTKTPNKFVQFGNFKSPSTDEFQRDLTAVNWHGLYICNDINKQVEVFNNILLYVMDEHCPIKTLKINKHKPPLLTYMLKKYD